MTNYWSGRKHTEEAKIKISKAGKGRKISEETRKKLSENNPRYWLGKTRILSEETKNKISLSSRGKKLSLEHRIKIGLSKKGSNCTFWKGGVSKENKVIRESLAYKEWRKKVFKRDNYTCVFCGISKTTIQADHIKPFALYPDLRLDVNNGRTLCVKCHKNTDTYGKNLPK